MGSHFVIIKNNNGNHYRVNNECDISEIRRRFPSLERNVVVMEDDNKNNKNNATDEFIRPFSRAVVFASL